MDTHKVDVLVVGSGFGACPPALRLSELGWKVLVIEKGKHIDPRKDLEQTQSAPYMQQYYRQYDGDGFGVTAVEGLGGGSGFYLGISLRTPSQVFEKIDRSGQRYWPKDISRKALEPYYGKAEQMLGVAQVPPQEVSKNGQLFAQMMNHLGLSSDRTRLVLKGCQKCGMCISGCTYDAKQALFLNYLPKAQGHGASVLTGYSAVRIKPVSHPDGYRYEVIAKNMDGKGKGIRRILAKIVSLGAGTIGSGKLLLQNRKHLPNLSPVLGQKMTGNIFFKTLGILPPTFRDSEMFRGYGLPGMTSYAFMKSHNMLLIPYKSLPIQMYCRIRTGKVDGKGKVHWWGAEHAAMMKMFRKRMFVLTATGFLEDHAQMRIKSGGQVDISIKYSESTQEQDRRNQAVLDGILERNGLEVVYNQLVNWRGELFDGLHYNTTHPGGSANMAETAKGGVVDSYCEVFGHEGLFVCDGAALASSLIVPPSLTILAIAERATERMVERLTAG